MNKEIEEKLLENSKGATYMSFILDVEIVIKKEGVERINLAESKVRADRIPQKKEESSKASKQQPSASGKQSEVKVYSMLSEPMSMNQHTRTIEEKQDISLSEKQDSDKKSSVSEDENIKKYEISENEEIGQVEEVPEESEAITPAEKLIQKKKKRKEDRKARVFKGKVEKIDFLECNRIFMCNYLKIPKCSISNKTIRSYGRRFPSVVIPKEVISSTSDSQSIFMGQKQSPACPKRYKIWKRNLNVNKINNCPSSDKVFESEFSSGDCTKKSQVNEESVEINNGNKVDFKQFENLNRHQAIQFKPPVIAVESCLTGDFPTHSPFKQSISKNYSTWSFLGDINKSKNKPIKKSESWPVIHNNQLKSTILFCPQHMTSCKESLTETPNKLTIQKSNTKMCKGLSSLEITFFNNTDKSINPQVSVMNGITQFMHISQNYKSKNIASEHLIEVEPESVPTYSSRISKTITRPIDMEDKLAWKSELEAKKSSEDRDSSQLTKRKPKRNILQFFYKLVT